MFKEFNIFKRMMEVCRWHGPTLKPAIKNLHTRMQNSEANKKLRKSNQTSSDKQKFMMIFFFKRQEETMLISRPISMNKQRQIKADLTFLNRQKVL